MIRCRAVRSGQLLWRQKFDPPIQERGYENGQQRLRAEGPQYQTDDWPNLPTTEVELEADAYYFKPTFLQGAPGQKLTLEIENESGTLHNISMPEQQLDVDIPPKGKVTPVHFEPL